MPNNENFSIHQSKDLYFAQMPNYIGTDKRLTPQARVILLYIKGNHPTWIPRRKDIEEKTGISGRTITRAFQNLEEYGYIERKQSKNASGQFTTDYKFYFDPMENPNYVGDCPERYFTIKKTPQPGSRKALEETSTKSIPGKDEIKSKKVKKILEDNVDDFPYLEEDTY